MEPVIKQLDSSVVKILCSAQIITSPSSVIKELVENALDAKATNIDVKLESFGLDRIEVRDNGAGVCAKDAKCMAGSHCTSKLCCYSDLEHVTSYGFRGEALSSIASIGDLAIATKSAQEVGISYRYDHYGAVVAQSPIAMNQGTSVIVTKLFKTLPVRRQYYTSINKRKEEIKNVENILKAYSIINCGVRFSLYHDRNLIWQKGRSEDIKSSLQQVFGIALLKYLEVIQYKSPDGKIQIIAYLPKRNSSVQLMGHSQPDMTFVFVNQRPVTLKFANQILKKNYSAAHALLGSQMKYPVACVNIQVPTETIDVNIDPSKSQVYFHSKEEVMKALNSILENIYELSEMPTTGLNAQFTNTMKSSRNEESLNDKSATTDVQESLSDTPESFNALLDDDLDMGWKIIMEETKDSCSIGHKDINELPRPSNVEHKDQLSTSQLCATNLASIQCMSSNKSENLKASQWSKGCIRDSSGEIIKPPQIFLGKEKPCLTKALPDLEIIDCPMKKKARYNHSINLTLDNFLESSVQNVSQGIQSNTDFDINQGRLFTKAVQAKTSKQESSKKHKSASQKLQSVCEKGPNKLSFFQKNGQNSLINARTEISETVKSVVAQFNFDKLKAGMLLSQSSSLSSTSECNIKNKIKIIGELDNGFWIVLHENQLKILSHHRMSETLLYQRLMEHHDIAKQLLEQPVVLTQSNLGETEWNALFTMTQPNLGIDDTSSILDNRIVKNGFGIRRYEATGEIVTTTLTLEEVASNIPFYGVIELKECLANITSNPHTALSESRPMKVVNYLKGEAVRMARTMPNRKSKDDLFMMLKNASENLPCDLNRCCHGQPFFTAVYNLANIPVIMEEE